MHGARSTRYLFFTLLLVLFLDITTALSRPQRWQGSIEVPKSTCATDSNGSSWENEGLLQALACRGGSWMIPAGWNPFGYKVTQLGEEFLAFEGSLDSDVGRFLASLKARKTRKSLKDSWLEVVRVAKTAQSMRIYKKIDELIQFCLKVGFLD